jgi:cytidine deaminase
MDRRTVLTTLGAVGMGMLGPWRASGETSAQGGGMSVTIPASFGKKSRELLERLTRAPGFGGRIPAGEAKKLAALQGESVDALMIGLIAVAQTYSRPPISNFHVGAVARGASGDLYFGMNIEIPGQALGFAVHGEQAAMSNAYMHGEHRVEALAVGGAPCGHCRQFILELSPDGSIQILTPGNPPRRLSVLLPSAFSPLALGNKGGALPPPRVHLSLPEGVSDSLAATALAAAERSYAPYSKSPSGVAIETRQGRIYKGSYIENVAFNPSLPPFQTALVAFALAGESNSDISQAVLVESESAVITQRNVAQDTLGGLAPAATLRVVAAKIKA